MNITDRETDRQTGLLWQYRGNKIRDICN